MNTWLLLYPTTKACVSLKFYTFIFLNIQFLNVVFTEPAKHYLGEHSICALKEKTGNKNKFIGLKVFLTMLVFVSTQSSNLWALSVCSSLPSTAQWPLPPTWRQHFQLTEKIEGMRGSLCVFVFRGGKTKTWKPPVKIKIQRKSRSGVTPVDVCSCKLSNSKAQPQCTFASPELRNLWH